MTRTYALKRLLEHGPMTPAEIVECTRWTARQADSALGALKACGLVLQVQRPQSARRGYAYVAVGVA